MDTKKWPVLAQILIGLGAIGGLINIVAGITNRNIIGIVLGIVGLVIYWNFYKFQKWAFMGVNILLSLSIVVSLLSIGKIQPLIIFVAVIYPALVLYYFNSKKIKALFNTIPQNQDPAAQP